MLTNVLLSSNLIPWISLASPRVYNMDEGMLQSIEDDELVHNIGKKLQPPSMQVVWLGFTIDLRDRYGVNPSVENRRHASNNKETPPAEIHHEKATEIDLGQIAPYF